MRRRARTLIAALAAGAAIAGLGSVVSPAAATLTTSDDDRNADPGSTTLIGYVYDQDEQHPAAGVTVRAYVKDGSVPDRTAVTDSSGRFEISGLVVAPYYVVARPPGGVDSWYPGGLASEAEADTLEGLALGEHSYVNEDFVVGDLRTMSNLSAPRLRGTPRVNGFLLADTGTWSEPDARTSVRWYVDGHLIGSETGEAFLPREADLGKRVTVVVTATRRGFRTLRATSPASGPVGPGTLLVDDVPTLTGEPEVGETLRVSDGAWVTARGPASVGVTHTWLRDGEPVGTGRTHRVTPRDAGATLRVRTVASKRAHRPTTTSTSAAVRKARSRTKVRARATGSHRVAVVVRIRVPGAPKARRTAVVKDGRRVVRTVTVPRNGRLVVRLRGLRAGRHVITVLHRGDARTRGSSDRDAVTVSR